MQGKLADMYATFSACRAYEIRRWLIGRELFSETA